MTYHHFAALGKMVLPDFVDLNKIAAGVFCWLYQYGMRHLGGVTAMVRSPEIF